MMDLGLQGKVALVSAGSAGLGYGCAAALVSEGCRVAICGRSRERLQKAVEQLSQNAPPEASVHGVAADVTQDSDVSNMIDEVRDVFGSIEILITNDGGPPTGAAEQITEKQLRQAYESTTLSAIRMIRLCLPDMIGNQWGRIVAITSMSVKQPIPNLALSNITRTALTGYLKTLSTEVAARGVTVNSILPGFHATDRLREFLPPHQRDDPKAFELFLQNKAECIPVNNVGDPMNFGQAAAFLCSMQAGFITGITLPVEGGATLGLL